MNWILVLTKRQKSIHHIVYSGFLYAAKMKSGFFLDFVFICTKFLGSSKSLNAIQQLIYNYNTCTFCCPWYLPFPSQPSSLSEPFLIWFSLEMVQDFLDLSSLTTLSKEENKILVSMLHKANVSWFDVQKVHTPVLLV